MFSKRIGVLAELIPLCILLFMAGIPAAQAHGNISVAYSEITHEGDTLKFVYQLDMYDMIAEINPDDPDINTADPQVLNRFLTEHAAEVKQRLLAQMKVYADHLPLSGTVTGLRYIEKEGETQPFAEAALEYPLRTVPHQFALDYQMVFERDQWHVNYVDLNLGSLQKQAVLIAQLTGFEAGSMSLPYTLKHFSQLGLAQPVIRYEPVLLLLVLLFACRSFKQSWQAAGAFAAGLSVTLLLGGLQILPLSGRLISALTALSIVYLVLQVWYTERRSLPLWGAAALGLIHGCGFALALAGLSRDSGYFAASAAAFYTGSLIALAFVMLVLASAAVYLRRWRPARPVILGAAALGGLLSFALNLLV